MFAALVLALALLQTGPPAPAAARAAAEADTARARVEGSVTFHPGALYSSTAGFGIGLGYRFRNLLRPGTRLHLRAAPAQHRGRYSALFSVGDPEAGRQYGLLSVFYETTGYQRFYGLGPAAGPHLVGVRMEALAFEARLGARRGPFLVQPSLRLLRHDVNGLHDPGDLPALDARARAHMAYLLSDDPRQAGLVPGLDVAFVLGAPERRGLLLQASLHRYLGLDDAPSVGEPRRFAIYSAGAFGFVPLGRGHTLALRAVVQTTHAQTDAPIPFYLLPEFGGRLLPGIPRYRFFGNDLVVAAAEVRRNVGHIADYAEIELALSVGVGGIYDDLGRQFSPAVRFDASAPPDAGRYPLRPAAGLGLRLVDPDDGSSRVAAVFGVSPEQWSIVTFRFVPRLTADRPLVR